MSQDNLVYSTQSLKHALKTHRAQLKPLLSQAINNPYYQQNYFKKDHPTYSSNNWESLPFTSRTFFQNYPLTGEYLYLMKSRPDAHGREAIIPFSPNDYKLMENMERYKFDYLGVRTRDIFGITNFSFSHFVPIVSSLLKIGVKYTVLEGNNSDMFEDIRKKNISVIFSTYTTLKELLSYASQAKMPLSIKKIFLGGEKISELNSLRKETFSTLGAKLIDLIGSREISCGYAYSSSGNNYHFFPANQLIEIIDPKTGQHSKRGEIVVTPYWRKDLPLLRFRTGDIIRLKSTDSHPKFEGILKKTDQTTKIHGLSMSLEELYGRLLNDLINQHPFDLLLQKWIRYPQSFLLLTRFNTYDRPIIFIEKTRSTILLRNSDKMLKNAGNKYVFETLPVYSRTDELKALSEFAHGKHFSDIRHLAFKNLPKKIRMIITKYKIKSL